MPDELKETETVAPPAPESDSLPPPRRRRLHIPVGLCICAGLFALALWGSWSVRFDDVDNQHVPDSPPDPATVAAFDRHKASPSELLARGDNALRQLRNTEALSHYKELLATGVTQGADLSYRLGACHEAVGQLDQAIASYRQAIGGSPSSSLTFACHLGMARCLLRQDRTVESRQLLYPYLLDEKRHEHLPQVFVLDACYLAALSLARENSRKATNRFSRDDPISFADVPLETRSYLDEIATVVKRKAESDLPQIPAPLAVQKRTRSEPAMVLCAEQTGHPASELLTQLAIEGGLKVEWTVEAKRSLADRSLKLHLHNWDLCDVLEHSSDYLGLACQIEENVVRFSVKSETEAKRLKAIRHGMTHRFLLAAIRADSAHPCTAAALLELGNNEAAQSRWAESASWYSRLIRDATSSPYVAPAYFSLAMVQLRNDEVAQARKSFFRVMDQSPGHELALRACIQIGQLYLHEDDARQAIVHLRRAQAIAVRSPYHPVATLTLAAAHLHMGDLEATRRTLAQDRGELQQAPFLPMALFLDRYVQFHMAKEAKTTKAGQREAADLVNTLWHNKEDTILGAYGQWLIARAYYDLGFWDQAEHLLRKSLGDAQGTFKTNIECTLAETLMKQSRRAEAAKILVKWADVEGTHRARSRFQLARIDLEEMRFKECSDTCRSLWNERSFADQTAILGLWGAALEGNGELAKAALCYAGKAPE